MMGSSSGAAPYSRTRRASGLLLTAGILGRTGADLAQGFRAQLETALDNLEGLLSEEGSSMSQVLRLACYLTDVDQLDDLNGVFTARFAEPRPARTTVIVAGLPFGALVEIEATAEITSPG